MAAAALPVAGCSPVSYPSMFPAVEQSPPPRSDTPMDANQVQRATEDLITDRNRLSAEAQGGGQPAAAPAAAKTSAGSPVQIGSPAVPAAAQAAGTETK
jgi:hypothetical protein